MYISVAKENGILVVKDDKGRILMKGKDDKIVIGRFPDLDERLKKYLADLYVDLTGEDIQKAKRFLNYENDENEFCS